MLREDSFQKKKKNIPYGQFQCLKRISDQEPESEAKAKEMPTLFPIRSYKTNTINKAYTKAKTLRRHDLLQEKQKEAEEQQKVCFMTKYNTRANKIKEIINNNWEIIESDPILKDMFPSAPVVSLTRAPTTVDKLVNS